MSASSCVCDRGLLGGCWCQKTPRSGSMLACRYMVLTNTEIAPLPAPILRSACPLHPSGHPTPALLLLVLPVTSPNPHPPTFPRHPRFPYGCMVLINTETAPLPVPIQLSACPLHPTPALLRLLLSRRTSLPPRPPNPCPAAGSGHLGGSRGCSGRPGGQILQDYLCWGGR